MLYLEKHIHDEDLIALAPEGVESVRERGEDANQNSEHPKSC